ncbi:Protein lon-1 [Caenorhabditis elegans]|uniref:Protein lon-1 n=1 Tax=Caenorhabditis elegans TaxID=6239 RepID=LON1_CAEEL|nr:Protein lon-1 [Caenorhabditis elegans]Q09566.1 RecName: Full=Protein lon-1; Flags: Precursor [Caenorhabditis elegans]CCD71508.1 Protein lon-1 [Caenorhabditis elegans]|eukprot:NP_498166.1 Protein lon-1 [Caenorhabditis elegans]
MNYLLTALIALLAPISVAYNVPHGFLTGEAVTSHSGPNDLDGELPATDEVKREKRGYFFPSHFQSDSGLLSRSEHPNEYLKKWITHEHNRYRRMVPASDMNMLYWSDELAASAQRHADTCDFRHSRGRINVGENIWAAPYSNYSDAISIWFNEVHNPRCGCNHAYKHCCGHYVQVVWAKTNLVGCGFSRCRDVQGVWGRGHRNVFVCHYNPQGNTVFVTARGQLYAMPAFTWASGDNGKCSNCPANAPACYQGLCYMPKNYEAPTTTTESTTTSTTTEEPTTTCEPDEPEAEGADNNQEEEEENNDGFRMRV